MCASSTPKDATDEAATFAFANGDEVRAYVNSLGKYTHINEQFINAAGCSDSRQKRKKPLHLKVVIC